MYLLDTDILGNLMRRAPSVPLLARIAAVPPDQQFTSSITLGELMYGAHRLSVDSARLLDEIEQKPLPNLPVLPFDASAARRYGEVRALLEGQGTPIGDADARIAGTALARGLTVVTANTGYFERVPGLSVEDWLS